MVSTAFYPTHCVSDFVCPSAYRQGSRVLGPGVGGGGRHRRGRSDECSVDGKPCFAGRASTSCCICRCTPGRCGFSPLSGSVSFLPSDLYVRKTASDFVSH